MAAAKEACVMALASVTVSIFMFFEKYLLDSACFLVSISSIEANDAALSIELYSC